MSDNFHTPELLKEYQSYPLDVKVMMTERRIHEFYTAYGCEGMSYGHCYVSFSGGKDSTVLLDIARRLYPNIRACFSNTGLEYPEIREFAQRHENVDTVYPKMTFGQVISKYGYPLIGKEVAEAIYYARRIRSQDVNVERERESRTSIEQYKRTELFGERTTRYSRQDGSSWGNERSTHTHTANGTQWTSPLPASQTDWRRIELKGERLPSKTRAEERAIRAAGVTESGQTGDGGVFSKPVEQFGEKSLFNKERWLPLARDIPVPISHYCCEVTKKSPMKKYSKQNGLYPIMATMAEESRVRKQAWMRTGCNSFDGKIQSKPMSFWTEQDVLQYIVQNNIEICSVYGEIVAVDELGNEYDPHTTLIDGCKLRCTGCQRTGCVWCAFGAHLDGAETRFQRLAKTHPQLYEYCIGGGQWVDNPAYDPTAPKFDGEWQNWNPKKIFVPSKKGIGLGEVFRMVNEIYGKDFYRW